MKFVLCLLIIAFGFSGCATTKSLEIEDLSGEIINLPFKIEKLSIIDHRDSLQSMDWDVPAIVLKKREWAGNPALSENNKADISRIILQSQDSLGVPSTMEFRVKEGICKLNTEWNSMTEYAKFRGELYVEVPERNLKYTTYAELYYDYSAARGSKEHVLILFDHAVRNATHMAVKKLLDQLDM